MPKVTVLMAVHNGERHLAEALDSIVAQTFRDFELLVVDDASSDESRAIVRSYDDNRIRLLENEANLGLTASLNIGIRNATGEYIARQDADDLSDPQRLSRQAQFLDDHRDVALLGTAYSRIDEEGAEFARRSVPLDATSIRWRLLFLNTFPHTSVMIRRSALDNVGRYDEAFRYAQDYELWSRIASSGHEVAGLPEVLVSYRSSASSMTSTYAGGVDEVERISARNIKRTLDAAGVGAPRRLEVDRDGVARLNFGDYRDLEARRARRAAADALTLQRPFATVNCATPVARRAHRARVAATLGRRLADLAARRRDPVTLVAAARTVAKGAW